MRYANAAGEERVVSIVGTDEIATNGSRVTGNTEAVSVQSRLLVRDSSVTASAFMMTQLISCRLPRTDSTYYGRRSFTTCAVSSLFRQVD